MVARIWATEGRGGKKDDTKGTGKSAAMISQMHLNVSAFPTAHFIGEKKDHATTSS